MEIIRKLKEVLDTIPLTIDVILLILTLIGAVYGAAKALLEVPDFVKDWWDRLQDRSYRVKTTMVKVMIGEDQTQIIKLRNVRVHTVRESLELDPVPTYGPGTARDDREAELPKGHYQSDFFKTHYSVPGRSSVVPEAGGNKFRIDFPSDEQLSPHHDHPILLCYFLNERLGTLFDPPYVEASQPVGSERLVIEVTFPPGWRLKDKSTAVETVDSEGNPLKTLDSKRARIFHYKYRLGPGQEPTHWIRAVIRKPPQDHAIRLRWSWGHSS